MKEIFREKNCPMSELVREALHYWLRAKGVDDGLIYDTRDFLREYEKASGG